MSDNATLFTAMAMAFPAIEGAMKDSDNPGFKRDGKPLRYADLSSVVMAIKPALSANKLFFAQITHEQQGGVCVETIVCHESGERMSFGKLFVPAGKQDAQGYGSALTYARRYSLMTAFGVCPEDDDGNAAVAAPADKPQTINEAQWTELTTKLEATNSDVGKFLKEFKCKSVKTLLRDDYGRALSMLEKKQDKMRAEAEKAAKPEPAPFDDLDEDSIPY